MTKEEIIDNIARLNSETWKDREEVRTEIGKLLAELKKALEQQREDCVSREELLKAMDTWDKFGYSCHDMFRLDNNQLENYVPYVKYEDMINCVKNMPPVIPTHETCKDCEHRGAIYADGECYCDNDGTLRVQDFYCKEFKRREE